MKQGKDGKDTEIFSLKTQIIEKDKTIEGLKDLSKELAEKLSLSKAKLDAVVMQNKQMENENKQLKDDV